MNLRRSIKKRLSKLFSQKYNFEKEYKKIPDTFEFPKFEQPLVSIIVTAYNQYKYTKGCLWSILKNTQIPYEIIIGDNKSEDETKDIETRIKNIKVIHHEENEGFLRNVNKTTPFANGKYIILISNDIIVTPNWLEPLVNTIESDTSIGIIAGRYLYPDGSHQEAGAYVYSNGITGQYGYQKYEVEKEYSYLREVDYCSGCGILFRKSNWKKLNGFDEYFIPAYYEDVDLAMRMKYILGLRIVYQPESKIFHFHGKTYSENASKLSEQNRQKFLSKWGEKIKDYPEFGKVKMI